MNKRCLTCGCLLEKKNEVMCFECSCFYYKSISVEDARANNKETHKCKKEGAEIC